MSGLPLFGLLIGQNAMKRNRRPQPNTVKAANNDGFEVRSAEKPISGDEQSPDILEEAENDIPADLKHCDDGAGSEEQCDSEGAEQETHSVDKDDRGKSDDADNKERADDKDEVKKSEDADDKKNSEEKKKEHTDR